ncbi:L-lactate dehydrogenase operon regulator [Salmonella enterica subsp. enterica serovar Sanjuan]|uniref:L-lactate dehydrogenase operon regulator n=1 Tax=Salmonella enterica subsp. enterica serovar Sanjuan TaxID=1160765 RepID=A0A447NFS0_SALET|nr:L-lactate dehydrogenase operon regulator [Salmonella enterica subsp. enterica serovar Sanjuan]
MIVMPKRLSDEIASRVRALIEEQNLEAGMKLPAERQLAIQLGVSRNSLREALAKLVSEGVLVSRRGGGTFVRWQHETWSEQNIVQPLKMLMANDPDYSFDILEARHAIEASTAWHAAMRATAADKEKIRLCFDATLSEDPDLASPGRRALSSGDRGSLAQCGAVANHARFLRRPAILRQTESPAYVSRSARILKADGTTPGGDGRHSGR